MTQTTLARGDAEIREFFFESRGTRLFAVERGQGTPVVLVHGTMADHRAVLPVIDQVRLIAPDLRGSGRSIDRGPLDWDQLAGDLVALLDHLQLERAVIGGVSSGATVAAKLALRSPHRIAGLVLVTPVHAGLELTPGQRATFEMMDSLGERALSEGVEVFRPLYERLPPQIREQAIAMLRSFDPGSVAASTRLLARSPQPFASPAELSAIEARALLVRGDDELHPASVSAEYVKQLRRCTCVEQLDARAVTALAEPRVHLVLGPVGSGKSTFAARLARERRAARFTLDQWMTALFRPDRPESGVMEWYVERAQRCVSQIWRTTESVLDAGTDVVLEIGLIRRQEREKLYRAAKDRALELYVLDAPRDVRRERVERRNVEQGDTFSMIVPPEIFELASDLWEPLDEEERAGRSVRDIDGGF